MTVRSQNGWLANDRSLISTRTVRGTRVRVAVRNGPAGDVLLEVAALFDLGIQDIDQGADDWGYAERPIRGSETVVSNHASGTAIDLNATRWPLGSAPSVNLTSAQIAAVRTILAVTVVRGHQVVRWGGDYSGRKDPMHFEINDGTTEAQCAQALAQLRAHYGDPNPEEDDLDATDKQMLAEVHSEITKRLDNRRGPNGQALQGGGGDTVLGYSTNSDGFGYRLEADVAYLHQKLDWLHDNPPVPQIDYAQLAAALLQALGR